MSYEKSLSLLCDTLRRSRVCVQIVSPTLPAVALLQGTFPFPYKTEEKTVAQFFAPLSPETLYRATSEGIFHARYLLLPDGRVLFIGPYLSAPVSAQTLHALSEARALSPKGRRYLSEFCTVTPILSEDSPLFALLDSFCEQIFARAAYAIVDVDERHFLSPPLIAPAGKTGEAGEDVLLNMQALERRYAFENELIEAVALGQLQKERLLTPLFGSAFFERRMPDALRNAKNYYIIMNTLLRKAAERGGVHPVDLDALSSAYAREIEAQTTTADGAELMRKMFRGYCRLVRKKTIQKYSRIVQQTIIVINADLSAHLSLSALAKAQGVSAPYLSTVFRRETGKTVSEYVRAKRMERAAHLLATTQLQVQAVAAECGILDLQYFSKLFRRVHGCAPKEYRQNASQN